MKHNPLPVGIWAGSDPYQVDAEPVYPSNALTPTGPEPWDGNAFPEELNKDAWIWLMFGWSKIT